jgi:hypothetical protein
MAQRNPQKPVFYKGTVFDTCIDYLGKSHIEQIFEGDFEGKHPVRAFSIKKSKKY